MLAKFDCRTTGYDVKRRLSVRRIETTPIVWSYLVPCWNHWFCSSLAQLY